LSSALSSLSLIRSSSQSSHNGWVVWIRESRATRSRCATACRGSPGLCPPSRVLRRGRCSSGSRRWRCGRRCRSAGRGRAWPWPPGWPTALRAVAAARGPRCRCRSALVCPCSRRLPSGCRRIFGEAVTLLQTQGNVLAQQVVDARCRSGVTDARADPDELLLVVARTARALRGAELCAGDQLLQLGAHFADRTSQVALDAEKGVAAMLPANGLRARGLPSYSPARLAPGCRRPAGGPTGARSRPGRTAACSTRDGPFRPGGGLRRGWG